MTSEQIQAVSRWSLTFCVLVLGGCGDSSRPPLGYVGGTVTMDGKPVENIYVVMKPEVGRQAMGLTNKDGKYEIEYMDKQKGTKVGPTIVSLEWPMSSPRPFPLSERYTQLKSELKLEVKNGRNPPFDIKIEPETKEEEARRKARGEAIVD